MKKVTMILAAVLFTFYSYAQKEQDKDVPASVKAALQSKYAEATAVEWKKEDGNLEAEFKIGKTEYSVVFDNAGKILETEVEIEKDALPAAAKEYISKNHAGQKIKEAAKITDHKGVVTYEAEIKGSDLMFDENGNFLKELGKEND